MGRRATRRPPAVTPPPGGPHGARFAAGAIAAVGVGLALVLRRDVVEATLKSPAALVRVAAIVLALVALSFVLRRFVANALVRSLVMAVPVLALVWLLAVPYFTDETVVEPLPGANVAADAAPTSTTPATATAADAGAAAPPVTDRGTPVAVAPATSAAVPATAEPVLLTVGSLRGIDHRASGTAAVYRLADGSHIVRLEDIDIQNGPDYFVHLVPGADRESPGGGFDLGALKGNQGSQNYAIPADADADVASGPYTVLVWCRAFSVPVANASQSPV